MKHEVVVHKAQIPLARGESINQYTQRLSEAARKYAITKLNIVKGGAYMCEAFNDSLVMDVYKRLADDGPTEYKYYSVMYTRKADGDFMFSSFTEVERVTSFRPKAPLAITKSLAESTDSPLRVAPPGWVHKSVWGGLL
jgi:hypothetical protein